MWSRGMDAPEPRQTNAERVLSAIRDGAGTQAEIVAETELDRGTVSRELSKLADTGQVAKNDGRPARYVLT